MLRCMCPPIDPRLVESRAEALLRSVHSLAVLTQRTCRVQWPMIILDEMNQHYQVNSSLCHYNLVMFHRLVQFCYSASERDIAAAQTPRRSVLHANFRPVKWYVPISVFHYLDLLSQLPFYKSSIILTTITFTYTSYSIILHCYFIHFRPMMQYLCIFFSFIWSPCRLWNTCGAAEMRWGGGGGNRPVECHCYPSSCVFFQLSTVLVCVSGSVQHERDRKWIDDDDIWVPYVQQFVHWLISFPGNAISINLILINCAM